MRSPGWILVLVSAITFFATVERGSAAPEESNPTYFVQTSQQEVSPMNGWVIEAQQTERDDPEESERERRNERDESVRTSDPDRAWLGVELQNLDESLREAFDFKKPGVLVSEVVPGSPADRAGIEEGDIIVRVDDAQVRDPEQVVNRIRDREPGDRISITRMRKGRERKVEVTLADMPERLGLRRRGEVLGQAGGYLGARTLALNTDLAPYFDVRPESGVLVIEIEEDSPAEEAGLKPGDIITQVDGERVSSPEELSRAIRDQDSGYKASLTVIRRGQERRIEATLASAPRFDRLRRLSRMRGDLSPMMDRMREGRDALAERIERLEEMMRDLERRLEEQLGRKDR